VSEQTDEIPVEQRQVIFKAVVEAQDGGQSVADSRAAVARQFSVTEEQVKQIEREGSDNQWPPL
jgi:hypothetical protein